MTIGGLLVEQVERAKAKRRENPVVTLTAEFPGDGSQVNLDWWLREVNSLTKTLGISFDFAGVHMVDRNHVDATRVATLENRLEEAKAYIADLEENMSQKIEEGIQAALGNQTSGLSSEESALRAVEGQGFYVDKHGAKWVDIRTEAKRIGKTYITLWRAAQGKTKTTSIESWVVGSTNANGDRMLVKQGSFTKVKRSSS